jgi:hypothetical protein
MVQASTAIAMTIIHATEQAKAYIYHTVGTKECKKAESA